MLDVDGAAATRQDLTEREADANALEALRVLVRQPEIWEEGDPEPQDVTRVVDRDDDVWTRREDGQWECYGQRADGTWRLGDLGSWIQPMVLNCPLGPVRRG